MTCHPPARCKSVCVHKNTCLKMYSLHSELATLKGMQEETDFTNCSEKFFSVFAGVLFRLGKLILIPIKRYENECKGHLHLNVTHVH